MASPAAETLLSKLPQRTSPPELSTGETVKSTVKPDWIPKAMRKRSFFRAAVKAAGK